MRVVSFEFVSTANYLVKMYGMVVLYCSFIDSRLPPSPVSITIVFFYFFNLFKSVCCVKFFPSCPIQEPAAQKPPEYSKSIFSYFPPFLIFSSHHHLFVFFFPFVAEQQLLKYRNELPSLGGLCVCVCVCVCVLCVFTDKSGEKGKGKTTAKHQKDKIPKHTTTDNRNGTEKHHTTYPFSRSALCMCVCVCVCVCVCMCVWPAKEGKQNKPFT